MKNTIVTAVIIAILFVSQSSAQSLSLVKDIAVESTGMIHSYPASFTVVNSKIYFTAYNGPGSNKLYQSDGTTGGTVFVGPTGRTYGAVWYLTSFNGKLIFSYDDSTNGLELWTSDGTTAGTVMIKDIWKGSKSSDPKFFTEANGKLFFQASDSLRAEGLWVTDGTQAGTVRVATMYAAPSNSSHAKFMVLNGKIYFTGNTGTGYGLWVSDGTLGGTQLVRSVLSPNGNYSVLNNKIYFSTGDLTTGYELWVSDGTLAGTTLVKNIRSDSLGAYSSAPDNFFTSNAKVYFTADDGIHGEERWVTDGTNAGTTMVKDIVVGANSSQPRTIIEFKGEVYFFVMNNGVGQMFKTDGTDAGTQLIKSLGISGAVPYVYEFNSKLYFYVGGETGTIWTSNGTTEGTNQIAPIVTTDNYNHNLSFIGYNGALFLPAFYNDLGLEFCKLSFPTAVHDRSGNDSHLSRFSLGQNYPNPFNPSTNIDFTVPSDGRATLKIFNAIGQEIATLFNGEAKTGKHHHVQFDASELATGLYVSRLEHNGKVRLKKLLLLK